MRSQTPKSRKAISTPMKSKSKQSTRMQVDEALRESEARYRAIYENSMDAILFTAPDGRIFSANPAACRMFGWTEEEICQLGRRGIIDDSDPRLLAALEERARTGKFNGELTFIRKDGSKFPGEISSVVFQDRDGHDRTSMVIRDITGRKQAEEALRQSEERFKYVFDHSVIGKSITLPSGEINVNKAFCGMLGYTDKELVNKHWQEITHPDDIELIQKELDTLLSGEKDSARFVKRYLHKSGSIVWTDVATSLRLGQDGKPLYFITAIMDITDRKRVEDALRESEEKLRLFIEHAPAALAMFDRDMRYIAASRRWFSDFNLNDTELIGKSHYEIFPELSDQLKAIHRRGMNGEMVKGEDDKFERADGSIQWLCWEMWPWKTADGSIGGIVIFNEDITERKKAEEKIRASLAEKEILLREVHHRVKNNLQAMIYLIDHRLDQVKDQESILILKSLKQQAMTIALVYEQLHQSVRVSEVRMKEYIPAVATNIIQAFDPGRRIGLKLECEDIFLDIDQAMPCGLMLAELVTNALKYAFPPDYSGYAQIKIKVLEKKNRYILIVSDNGIGLPEDIDPKTAKSMGLRLVTLWATHQLGGTIEVDKDKEGLTYHITFPKKRG